MLSRLLRFAAYVLDCIFLSLKMYRWAVGGIYELWWMPDGMNRYWHRVPTPSDSEGTGRPGIFCMGAPIVESYPTRRWTHYFPCCDNSTETFEKKLFTGIPREMTDGRTQIQT